MDFSIEKKNQFLHSSTIHTLLLYYSTVQLSALHDTVQDKFIFNSASVSSKPKMGIIWKVHFWNVGQFG